MKKQAMHLVIVEQMRDQAKEVKSSFLAEEQFRMLGDILKNSELSRNVASELRTPLRDIMAILPATGDGSFARAYLEELIRECELIKMS